MQPMRLFQFGDLFLRVKLGKDRNRAHESNSLFRKNDRLFLLKHIE